MRLRTTIAAMRRALGRSVSMLKLRAAHDDVMICFGKNGHRREWQVAAVSNGVLAGHA
tara:strand:- start:266 stop:439 length:174 start_codon:yes stop_codon:yes gene_type:complete